jgi:hypothetical protein
MPVYELEVDFGEVEGLYLEAADLKEGLRVAKRMVSESLQEGLVLRIVRVEDFNYQLGKTPPENWQPEEYVDELWCPMDYFGAGKN